MSSKRSRSEADVEDHESPDVAGGASSGKRRKPNMEGKGKAKKGSNEWSRKRIRAIQRLLQRDQGMPQDARNTLERELAGLHTTMDDNTFQKKRSDMISRYHMVRFFERKKAMRLAKQIRRKIEATEDPSEKRSLQRDLHIAEVDEAYAQHFPHAETYISLYRNAKGGKDDDDNDDDEGETGTAKGAISSERPPIWKSIEEAMEKGPQALARIRERRPEVTAKKPQAQVEKSKKKKGPAKEETGLAAFKSRPAAQPVKPTATDANGKSQLNRRERRKLMREAEAALPNDDDEDGGGFLDL